MTVPTKGEFVWLDSGSGVPIGAEVRVTDFGQLYLNDDEGKVGDPVWRVFPSDDVTLILG